MTPQLCVLLVGVKICVQSVVWRDVSLILLGLLPIIFSMLPPIIIPLLSSCYYLPSSLCISLVLP
jgi:hypothetical protein